MDDNHAYGHGQVWKALFVLSIALSTVLCPFHSISLLCCMSEPPFVSENGVDATAILGLCLDQRVAPLAWRISNPANCKFSDGMIVPMVCKKEWLCRRRAHECHIASVGVSLSHRYSYCRQMQRFRSWSAPNSAIFSGTLLVEMLLLGVLTLQEHGQRLFVPSSAYLRSGCQWNSPCSMPVEDLRFAPVQDSLDRIVPEGTKQSYRHIDEGYDDMPAHVKSSLMGASLAIPVSQGRFALGTWQGIYLNEHRNYGGPRTIVVTIQGQRRAN
eukprot:evm.model.scf_648.8 EVM.evm.TU.scf_648.8   scf_648:64274-65851(+)